MKMIRRFPPQSGNPGNGSGLSACDSPNPPFWCDEYVPEPSATIDEYAVYVLIFVASTALIQVLYYNFIKPFIHSKFTIMETIKNYTVIALFILALMGLLTYLMMDSFGA